MPEEADIVIDARFLKNPFFEPKLQKLTGKDTKIQNYVFNSPQGKTFLNKTQSYINYVASNFKKASKAYLNVAIGCTGGKHRSVGTVEKIKKGLKSKYKNITVNHRDIRL